MLANALLDDMDFDRYGKVKCLKIEGMLPKLMKMVEGEDEITPMGKPSSTVKVRQCRNIRGQ